MTDDELHDDLTEIRGVGDATADEILETIHDTVPVLTADGPDPTPDEIGEAREQVREAREHHDAGEHRLAAKFVRRAADALDG